jgi:hypothetical protein
VARDQARSAAAGRGAVGAWPGSGGELSLFRFSLYRLDIVGGPDMLRRGRKNTLQLLCDFEIFDV